MSNNPKAEPARRRAGATVLRHNVVGRPVDGPVVLDRRRRRLSAVVKRYADQSRSHIVSVHRRGEPLRPQDHTVRLRGTWAKTLVAHDDIILITYLPRGGGGSSSGKQIGAAIAVLALAVIAPYAVGALGAGTSLVGAAGALTPLGTAVSAGIVVAGGYLASLATRPKSSAAIQNQSAEDTRPLYGVSGGGNLPRKGDRIPVCYGAFVMQPDLSQPDYAIYNGEDVIHYKRLTLGLGKYDIEAIYVGAATLWTAEGGVQPPFAAIPGGGVAGGRGGSELSTSSGTYGASAGLTAIEIIPPGGTSTLVPGSVYTVPSVGGTELPRPSDNPSYSGPWAVCPVGTTTKRIQVDYQVPALMWTDSDLPNTCAAVFEYAPCDDDDQPTGAWAPLHVNGITSRWTRAVRFTRIIDVPEGRYIVRGKNTVAYADNRIDAVIWDGLRAHFEETIIRPHVTEIALRIQSGKATAAVSFADIWVKATRILPVWDSGEEAWVEQPTRKAVWAYLDVLQANYGGNLDDSRVDHERPKFYAAGLTEFDTFDGVIRGPVSVYEAASVVLGPMRAEPAMIGSLWSIVRDEPKSVRKHVFSRRQIMAGSTGIRFDLARDTGDADVIVEYSPGGDQRLRRERRKTFGAASLTPRRHRLEGVSSYRHATHLATWLAASAFYRREKRKIACDRQGRIVTRGDPALIDAWFLSDARAGGVMARADRVLTLDTEMEVGPASYAMLRDRRGREWGPIKVTQPDPAAPNVVELDAADMAAVEAFYEQTLSEVLAADSQEMTTALVGPLQELQDPYLVRSVEPHARDRVAIEAVRDAPEVWTALAEELPPEPPLPSAAAGNPYPVVPWVRGRCVQKALSLEMEWSCGTARGAASYTVLLSYDDGETYETVSTGQPNSGSHPLRHVEGQTVQVVAYAIDATGVPGPAVATTLTTVPAIVVGEDIASGLREWLDGGAAAEIEALRARINQVALGLINAAATSANNKKDVRTDLVASEGRSSARITEVQTVAASETAAAAARIDELEATVDTPTTGLTARVTATEAAITDAGTGLSASALRIDELEATVDTPTTGLTARVTATEAAITDAGTGLSASATRISELEVTVDTPTTGLTARLDITEGVVADLEAGAAGAYGVKLNASGHGVELQLLANGSGSSAKLKADEILLDGSVNVAKLAVNSVSIEKIIDGAVTGLAYVKPANSSHAIAEGLVDNQSYFAGTQEVSLGSLNYTAEIGVISVDLQFYSAHKVIVYTTKRASWVEEIRLYIDGVLADSWPVSAVIQTWGVYSGSFDYTDIVNFFYRNWTGVVSVGSHTLTLKAVIPATYHADAGGSYPRPLSVDYKSKLIRAFERKR